MSKLDQKHRGEIPDRQYAFPKQEKEPLNDAAHVRNAIARFNQVQGVSGRRKRRSLEAHPRGGQKVSMLIWKRATARTGLMVVKIRRTTQAAKSNVTRAALTAQRSRTGLSTA